MTHLSSADVSWIRLGRHDQECHECLGLRSRDAQGRRSLLTIPPTSPEELTCDERKRLLSEHQANMKAEKEARRT